MYRFAFLSTFRLPNRTSKITRILTLYQANAAGKILIKSLQECKGHNAWQFVTEFLNRGWTKNSINRLLAKFRTVDRRPGTGRRRANPDKNVDTVESLLLSQKESERQTSEPSNNQRNFTWSGGSVDHQFRRLFTKICVSSATRKGALNSWLKRTACTRYFRYVAWETITL